MEGTTAARNHWPQVRSTPRLSWASWAQSGLAAMPVRNIAPVIGVNWKQVMTRKSPMRLPVGPGWESRTWLMDFAIGSTMPPERAVTEGMAGAMIRSARPSE